MIESMHIIRPSRRRRTTGSILVLVLIVVSSLTALSVGLAYRTRIQIRLAHANAKRTQSYYLALGGVERIKTLLATQGQSPHAIAVACRFTRTAKDERLFEQLRQVDPALAQGITLAYSLRDELGHFNINSSDPSCWENMECVGETFHSSVLDWIDEDDDRNPDGAETDFYQRIEPPHISKNSPCLTLKELLYVKAVTRDVYVGEDLNRNRLLDKNENDGAARFPPDNQDGRLDGGILDGFTVCGDGRVNINTASEAVLSALQGIGDQAAILITAHRAGPDGVLGTDDDLCFVGGQDIAEVEGLTGLQVELLQQYCRFDTTYFRIFSSAGLNDEIRCSLMATAKYEENKLQVVYLERVL